MSRATHQELFAAFASHVKNLQLGTFDDVFPNTLVPLAHRLAAIRREQQAAPADDAYRAFVAWSIPIWEATHVHTSILAPLAADPHKQTLLLQLLGYVYPDAGDKRCFFRPLCLAGDATEAPGHLHVPRVGPLAAAAGSVAPALLFDAVPSAHGGEDSSDACKPLPAAAAAATGPVQSHQTWHRVVSKLRSTGWLFEQEVQAKQPQSMAQLRDLCRGFETILKAVVVVATKTDAASEFVAAANQESAVSSRLMPSSGGAERDRLVLFHQQDVGGLSGNADVAAEASIFSVQTFRHLLTYTILLCHRMKETAEFAVPVLRVIADSDWLRRSTYAIGHEAPDASALDQQIDFVASSWTHAHIFGDLLELWRGLSKETRSCVPSEGGLTPQQQTANTQWRRLVVPQGHEASDFSADTLHREPRVSAAMQTIPTKAEQQRVGPTRSRSEGDALDDTASEPCGSFALRSIEAHKSLVLEDIPMEQRFADDGQCSHLRDTDRLVRFLRSVVRLPMIRSHDGLFKDLVLNRRKRSRTEGIAGGSGAAVDNEGRVLLPTTESLGDVLHHTAGGGGGGVHQPTPQERIVLRFAAAD